MSVQLKIGLAGFFHANARGDEAAFNRAAQELASLASQHRVEILVVDRKIYTAEDATTVVKQLNLENVDFTLLLSASVANGDAVKPFAGLSSRIGVWALPESEQTGFLPMNSFCGTMVIAGILGTFFHNKHIVFKWFYGYPSSSLFQERFGVTVGAIRAIQTLQQSRIGCLGPLVTGFDHLAVDEAQIKSRLGTTISRVHALEEITGPAKKMPDSRIESEIDRILSEGHPGSQVSQQSLMQFARLNLALNDFALENGYDALAISCWTRLQKLMGVVACGPISRLNEAGIIAACEADVDGAIGMLVDRAISGKPATLVDLVSLDMDDQSLNVWHCGPAPRSMADSNGVTWDQHFDIGEYRDGSWYGQGAVASLQFKPGVITLSRISTKMEQVFVMTATMSHKPGYQGSSGWIQDFAMQGRKPSLQDLIAMVYNFRLDHHMTVGYGSHEAVYLEFANWLGLSVCPFTAYVPYLEPDKR